MGHETRSRAVHVVAAVAALLGVCVASGGARAAMTIVHESQEADSDFRPLTTARVWQVAPEDSRPMLTHWVLERRLGIRGLKAVAGSNGFSIQLGAVVSKTIRHRREAPAVSDFSTCVAKGQGDFTEASLRWVLGQAEKKWEAMIQEALPALELKLKKIRGLHEVHALQLADYAFLEWSQSLHDDWHQLAKPRLEQAEFEFLKRSLRQKDDCVPARDHWKQHVEKPYLLAHRSLVARAPAKIWDRGISIRVDLHLFEQKLSGVFLVDPSSEVSLIHPDFLQRQGIETDWLVTRGVVPQKIRFQGEERVAQPVVVSRTLVGGADLGHWQYWMTDTEIFTPPAFRQACCDGVLGLDVIRKFAVEFDPKTPVAVTFWNRADFSLGKETEWKPVRMEQPVEWPFRMGDWAWGLWPSVLDLSNGRWWFPEGDQAPTLGSNTSGLVLRYVETKQERELKVISIQPRSSAATLARAGLKSGISIVQVNGVPSNTLDQWQIDRLLRGSRGQTVMLEWATPSGPRIAPLLINK